MLKKIKLICSIFKKAIFNPEKSPSDNRIFIKILMKPIIFDLYAAIIQINDLRKVYKLQIPNSNKTAKDNAYRHNLAEIQEKIITTTRRVEPAYQIATVPWRSNKDLKLLIIGCRNILELKQASFFGFQWKNINGLDLFSTNKKIIECNMEEMNIIDDSTYDVVTMVNTLAYSDKPERVIKEISRILKKDGRFVYNHTFNTDNISGNKSPFTGDEFVDYSKFTEKNMESLIKKAKLEIYYKYKVLKKDPRENKNNILEILWYGLYKK